jgi:hypothetical protein
MLAPETAIISLPEAKSIHLQWQTNIQTFLAGIPFAHISAPVNYKKCKFGQWFLSGRWKKIKRSAKFAGIERPLKSMLLAYPNLFNKIVQKSSTTAHPGSS